MKKVDKLREEVESLIKKQLTKLKDAKKAHEITNVVDWLDQELFDSCQQIMVQIQKGIYLPTNKDLDKFYEQELD